LGIPHWTSWSHPPPRFENNYFTEMCSGSEEGSYLRLIDFLYHSTLGLRVMKKKKTLLPKRWSSRASLVQIFERYVTKFAPHTALKLIA